MTLMIKITHGLHGIQISGTSIYGLSSLGIPWITHGVGLSDPMGLLMGLDLALSRGILNSWGPSSSTFGADETLLQG